MVATRSSTLGADGTTDALEAGAMKAGEKRKSEDSPGPEPPSKKRASLDRGGATQQFPESNLRTGASREKIFHRFLKCTPQVESVGFHYKNIRAAITHSQSLPSKKPANVLLLAFYQEKMKVCSGRDELCHSVLNDEWASHPTWASEDSGFVAHRKNNYEEVLHRIEEERHDYDFNIEALFRTIQLLQPYTQQLLNMTEAERKNMRLPDSLGGQSRTIHKRVIKKVYGREKGELICQGLLEEPGEVIPLLINRLQAKLEEWKSSQVSITNQRQLLHSVLTSEAALMEYGLAGSDKQIFLQEP